MAGMSTDKSALEPVSSVQVTPEEDIALSETLPRIKSPSKVSAMPGEDIAGLNTAPDMSAPKMLLAADAPPDEDFALADTLARMKTLKEEPVADLVGSREQATVSPISEAVVAVPPHVHSKRFPFVPFLLLVLLLLGIVVPLIFAVGYGMNAAMTYTTLRNQAHSGVEHLLNVKTIFTGVSSHPTGFFDTHKLHLAQEEFVAARHDFQQLQYTLDHTSIIHTVTDLFPAYRSQVSSARAASQIGIDVADIGQKLTNSGLLLAPSFHGSLLGASSEPLVTPAMLDLIRETIDYSLPRLSNIEAQTRLLSLDALPITAQQRDQFVQLIQALPQAVNDLKLVRGLLDSAGWLLGVDAPRTFLVQTMDRAELRPTGGFTGQYGELTINGGRIAPFSLKDISLLEYVDNSPTLGQSAPEEYRSWWPFANWGLRDSNLSADFPISAQIAINQYEKEARQRVDGVILFTPFLVEHVLQIIGPVQVPAYNETITALNLEEKLHYYQQDNAGIYKQIRIQGGDKSTSYRKQFTALLAHVMMDQIRQTPPDELIAIAHQMLHDLKTKELQVYMTNPQIEGLLQQLGDAGQLDRSTTHDGLYVVQANISASKASQYVRTSIHDTVTLDGTGGATHVMQLRLIYNQLGPVYGYDTYRDYVRVYVPPSSKLLWGDGFDTGDPLCSGYYRACPDDGIYPDDELVCPTGLYQAGAIAPAITDPDGGRWRPLDTIGPPTNTVSDETGRAMFGGLVVVPKNCTMTVTLSWYVPPMGQSAYSLLVQRQAGTFAELDLTALPTPGNCATLKTPGIHYDGILSEDASFRLNTFPSVAQTHTEMRCYPQLGV